jgi:hypothetical protein
MSMGTEPCPSCGLVQTQVVWGPRNILRIGASLVLLPFYVLGGLAGDHRGPILPLEQMCVPCGKRFKERSVIECVKSIWMHK